ncbi:recombinase family protein [Alicyclobacillus tolerans]|uniref:recombinase family protein n=1 Tax=Alicyclobacillus tolerans TaxID=90970 RepID=UPI001F01E6F4|nr:recombinase family protein [Alicyclobacillus tolerans]MCF8566966.1 recombinase family protein [Alicyclobacillus tolerans]
MITLKVEKGFQNPFNHREMDELVSSIDALIYARVSTEDQAKHGYSLESQVDRCVEKLIKDYAVDPDNIIALIEMGEMGDNPNRPALSFAKTLIEKGVGRKFAVLHPDRLARDFRLQVELIEDVILGHGLELVSVEVPYDPSNAEAVLFFNMQGIMAQYIKAKIVANSKRGRRTQAKNGKIPGVRRIYGYRYDKENDILVEDPFEKEIYLKMVEWILNGKDGQPMNLTGVARELALLGIPAPSGDKWYQSSISRILKNTVYTGRFYFGKTEYKQKKGKIDIIKKPESEWQLVKVPAFIDEDTYERLQKKIATFSYANRGAKPKVTYLLKGLVRCGRCGSAVVAGTPSRHKITREPIHHYYKCSGKTRKVFEVGTGRSVHDCKGKNWRQDVIDEYVWKYLVRMLTQPEEVLRKIIENQDDPSHVQGLLNKLKTLETALDEKQAERKRWLNLNVKGRIDDEELDEALLPLDKDIEQLKESILLTKNALESLQSNQQRVDEVKQTIESFKRYIREKISDEEKRKYVSQLVKKVVLYDDEIEIYTAWDITTPSGDSGAHNGEKPLHTQGSNNSFHGQRDGGLQKPIHCHHCRIRARDGLVFIHQPRLAQPFSNTRNISELHLGRPHRDRTEDGRPAPIQVEPRS